MISVEEEFRPGTRFFSEQLLKVFNCIEEAKKYNLDKMLEEVNGSSIY